MTSANECSTGNEAPLPTSFFSESKKIKKSGDGFLILRALAEPELAGVSVFSDALGVINAERGSLTFVKDSKVIWELKDNSLNIYDFDVNSKGDIIAIAQESTDLAKILRIDTNGKIKSANTIEDTEQNSDVCLDYDAPALHGFCNSNDKNKHFPKISFPSSFYNMYTMAKISWGKTTDDFFLIIDRGQREVTTLYKWSMAHENKIQLEWKRPVLYSTKLSNPQVMLTSGWERYGLNRFGKFGEKYIQIDNDGNAYVAFSAFLRKNEPIVAHLESVQNLSLIKTAGPRNSFILKFSPDGDLLWAHNHTLKDLSTANMGFVVGKNYLFMGSHTFNDKNHYRILIHKIATIDGSLSEAPTVLSLQEDNSYGHSITLLDADKIMITGLTGFKQSPAGMSLLDYGIAFVTQHDFSKKESKTHYFKKSKRKDILTSSLVDNSQVYFLLDSNGPITHSADTDAKQAYQNTSVLSFDINTLF